MSTPDQNQNPQEPSPDGAYQPEPSATPAPADPYGPPPGAIPPQPQYGAPQFAAPQYGTQPYAPPQYSTPSDNPKNWMGIVSLVTSLLGMSIIGIVFGHLGLNAVKKGQANNKGLSIAGLIIGYLGLVASIIAVFVVISVLGACADDPNCVSEFNVG